MFAARRSARCVFGWFQGGCCSLYAAAACVFGWSKRVPVYACVFGWSKRVPQNWSCVLFVSTKGRIDWAAADNDDDGGNLVRLWRVVWRSVFGAYRDSLARSPAACLLWFFLLRYRCVFERLCWWTPRIVVFRWGYIELWVWIFGLLSFWLCSSWTRSGPPHQSIWARRSWSSCLLRSSVGR